MLILFAIILCVSVFMIPVSIYSYSKYITEVNKPKPKRELKDLSYKFHSIKYLEIQLNLLFQITRCSVP